MIIMFWRELKNNRKLILKKNNRHNNGYLEIKEYEENIEIINHDIKLIVKVKT